MNTFVLDAQSVSIPEGVRDLETFRLWAHSEQLPERGRVSYHPQAGGLGQVERLRQIVSADAAGGRAGAS